VDAADAADAIRRRPRGARRVARRPQREGRRAGGDERAQLAVQDDLRRLLRKVRRLLAPRRLSNPALPPMDLTIARGQVVSARPRTRREHQVGQGGPAARQDGGCDA
jgi:hypothetical protein